MTEATQPKHRIRDMVTYVAGPRKIRAQVLSVHRDGSCTIEARHFLDESGAPIACYLGYRFRMPASALIAA